MAELFLIYVGSAGKVGELEVCDFYFSSDPDSAIGPGWEEGARDNVEPPDAEFIQAKLRLVCGETPLDLRLLENEYELCYLNGVYGTIALAWEDVKFEEANLNDLSERFLNLRFGDSLSHVQNKLAERGAKLVPLEEVAPDKKKPKNELVDFGDFDD